MYYSLEMESTFARDLISAMAEAAAHAQGNGAVAREHVVDVPDVRAIREMLGLGAGAAASRCDGCGLFKRDCEVAG
jgi:putative transcriptional regulator